MQRSEFVNKKGIPIRKLITRILVLLFATAMIASVVAGNLNPTAVNAETYGLATAPFIAAEPNPLLAEWEGPYGGVPPFDKVQIALFKPALESAMTQNLSEIAKI